jgi:hypothetical protein
MKAVELGDLHDIACNMKDKVHATEIDSLPSTTRWRVCHYIQLTDSSVTLKTRSRLFPFVMEGWQQKSARESVHVT